MALIYLDPVNGNDANSGLTFALRKKTVTSAGTAAGASGEIRIIKSPEPTAIGTCTWTNNSNVVTIPAGTVVNIENCESGWTAATNVTNTYSTTCRQGTYSLSMAVGASFTTGKAAYKAVSMDLTGYQQLSFWVRQASGTVATAGQVSIKLCSDATGDTPVYSFDVPKLGATGCWHCFTVDLGSGMGAISSIAIYINSDLGAQTFLFDNILASKAPSAADSLSLVSLISKNVNDEAWLPIRSIVGTSLILDRGANNTETQITSGAYYGATESISSYKREVLKSPIATGTFDFTFWQISQANVTVSGGWNETDMDTQTGETFLDGTAGVGIGCAIQSSGTNISKISWTRYGQWLYFNSGYGANGVLTIDSHTVSGNTTLAQYNIGAPNVSLNLKNLCNNMAVFNMGYPSTAVSDNRNWSVNIGNLSSSNINISLIKSSVSLGNILGPGSSYCVNFSNLSSSTCAIANVKDTVSGQQGIILLGTVIDSHITINGVNGISGAGAFSIASVSKNSIVDISNCVFTGVTNTIVDNSVALVESPIFVGGVFTRTGINLKDMYLTFINTTFSQTPEMVAGYLGRAICQDYNGVAGDVRIFDAVGNIQTATDQRQTGTGYSWKFSPNSNTSSTYPLELELAKLPISAESITFSIYIRRTDSSSTASIIAKKGQLGLTSDVISSSTVTGSWEKVTLTVTPTVQGVLTLHMQAYGTTPVWFDTFGVEP